MENSVKALERRGSLGLSVIFLYFYFDWTLNLLRLRPKIRLLGLLHFKRLFIGKNNAEKYFYINNTKIQYTKTK